MQGVKALLPYMQKQGSITIKLETQEELIRRKNKKEGKLEKNITWDEFLLEATHGS